MRNWGFLDAKTKHRFLRPQLAYPNVKIYYIGKDQNPFYFYQILILGAIANLVLRFGWVVTLSPNIFDKFFRPAILQLVVGFGEMIRRGIWNLFS